MKLPLTRIYVNPTPYEFISVFATSYKSVPFVLIYLEGHTLPFSCLFPKNCQFSYVFHEDIQTVDHENKTDLITLIDNLTSVAYLGKNPSYLTSSSDYFHITEYDQRYLDEYLQKRVVSIAHHTKSTEDLIKTIKDIVSTYEVSANENT